MNADDATLAIAVYCGSRFGDSPGFADAARRLGRLIAEQGGSIVYGGGRVGLMGAVADAALGAGGRVIGVIPQALMDREVGHRGLSELHVVETMHERKQAMAVRADAFVCLPGGIGTLEEMYEVWSWQQLGYHDKPVALLNVDGYFDALLEFHRVSQRRGFVSQAQYQALLVDDDPVRLLARVRAAAARATAPDDYLRMRTTCSTAVTKILPSPILPVLAALTIASMQRSTSSFLTTTSTFTLGRKSTTYSAPR
jgi:uncharacterized protein (TIGR00730 family)